MKIYFKTSLEMEVVQVFLTTILDASRTDSWKLATKSKKTYSLSSGLKSSKDPDNLKRSSWRKFIMLNVASVTIKKQRNLAV